MNDSFSTTHSKNTYFIDKDNDQLFFIHPIIKLLADIEINEDPENWINNRSYPFKWQDYIIKSKEELFYYFKKYTFLKTSYKRNTLKYNLDRNVHLHADNIKNFIANTTQIVFETTERCNLNCIYCTYGELYESEQNKNRHGVNLNFEDAKVFLDYVLAQIESKYNQSYQHEIRIGFYGGEPLMNFHLIENVVNYCKAFNNRKVSFSFGMTTNGLLLHKYIDFLVKNKFHVLISLDGNKENNSLRVFPDNSSSYKSVKKNIDLIQNSYKEYFNEFISFNAVIHSYNSYFQVYDYFTKKYAKWPSCSMMNSSGIENCKKDEYDFISNKEPYREFDEIENKEFYNKHIFSFPEGMISRKFVERCHDVNIVRSYRNLLMRKENINIPPTGTCLPFSKKIYLTAKGLILPCERIDHSHFLGFCENGNIHLDFEEIAQKYNQYYANINKDCMNCHIGRLCDFCLMQFPVSDKEISCPYKFTRDDTKKLYTESLEALENHQSLYYQIMENKL